jgi:hypothetical protein
MTVASHAARAAACLLRGVQSCTAKKGAGRQSVPSNKHADDQSLCPKGAVLDYHGLVPPQESKTERLIRFHCQFLHRDGIVGMASLPLELPRFRGRPSCAAVGSRTS